MSALEERLSSFTEKLGQLSHIEAKSLQSKVKDLLTAIETRIKAIEEENRKSKIDEALKILESMGLKPQDLVSGSSKGASTRKSGGKIPPKYKDPMSESTWTGRGSKPKWIKEADAAGTPREQFLIEPQAPK